MWKSYFVPCKDEGCIVNKSLETSYPSTILVLNSTRVSELIELFICCLILTPSVLGLPLRLAVSTFDCYFSTFLSFLNANSKFWWSPSSESLSRSWLSCLNFSISKISSLFRNCLDKHWFKVSEIWFWILIGTYLSTNCSSVLILPSFLSKLTLMTSMLSRIYLTSFSWWIWSALEISILMIRSE